MMAVDISTQSGFAASKGRMLFQGRYVPIPEGATFPNYDVSSDGQHFLMLKPVDAPPPTQINIVLNWFEELRQKLRTK